MGRWQMSKGKHRRKKVKDAKATGQAFERALRKLPKIKADIDYTQAAPQPVKKRAGKKKRH